MDFTQANGNHDSSGIQNDLLNGEVQPKPLNIAIVGAGIGGLSAAIFLRQQGHNITLFEQSRFANEIGAAVHLAPNSNGLLRRMGLYAEKIGAIKTQSMAQYFSDGKVMFTVDVTKEEGRWQHPWLLAHRANLHSELKRRATMEEGKGRPAVLNTSSKVVQVTTDGVVTLADGETFQADVIVGADGVHSKTRYALPGSENIKPFGSGKSGFRFLLSREKAMADPETRKYAEQEGHLSMFFARDRRVVIYPTNDNTVLNFNNIHPTAESKITGGDWQQKGNVSTMLEVYKDFDPALVKLVGMADEESLRVWELLDMPQLPTWTDGKLVLIGDAAHPFTPHQGQGAGQAIEDAASLAVMLPLNIDPASIPSRLKLYEKCRYERASRIQEYSRIAGRDLGDGKGIDAYEYTGYNFGHDEWDYSTQKLREWEWERNSGVYWRMPLSFGPMPGPRQDHFGGRRVGEHSTFTTASVKIKTSRTVLQNLLPTKEFKFQVPDTFAYATFSITTLGNLDWLGGNGYSHFGLYIHGVQYTKQNGEVVNGTYLPILFENLADPILSGREELGMPKLFCDLDIEKNEQSWALKAGWMGTNFCDITIRDLQAPTANGVSSPSQTASEIKDEALLFYKHIPKTGAIGSKERGQADIAYPVMLPHAEDAKTVERRLENTKVASKAEIKWDGGDWKSLPTLHHVVQRLAEIPVYDVVEAKVVQGRGVSDVSAAKAIS